MTYLILLALIVVAALVLAARLFPRSGATPRGAFRRRPGHVFETGGTRRGERPEEGDSR